MYAIHLHGNNFIALPISPREENAFRIGTAHAFNLHMFCRGHKNCRDAAHALELTFSSQTWTTGTHTSTIFNYNPFSNAHLSRNFPPSCDSTLSRDGPPMQPYQFVDVRHLNLVWGGWLAVYAPSSSSPTRMAPSFPRPWAQKPSRETELHEC